MIHEYTQELLYHFNCGNCKNWWSYATTVNEFSDFKRTLYCPHCGVEAPAAIKSHDN